MSDLLEQLRQVTRLRGDTYSSAEVLGMVGRAAGEIERLRAYIWTLDGKTVCSKIDGDKFADEGIIVASDICPLPSHDQQSALCPTCSKAENVFCSDGWHRL